MVGELTDGHSPSNTGVDPTPEDVISSAHNQIDAGNLLSNVVEKTSILMCSRDLGYNVIWFLVRTSRDHVYYSSTFRTSHFMCGARCVVARREAQPHSSSAVFSVL